MAVQAPVVVRAKEADNAVNYHVYSGEGAAATLIKAARYSELCSFHAALLRDVPNFTGALPRKTMRRNLSIAFIESRRADIELYLNMALAQCQHSDVLQDFFGAPHISHDEPSCEDRQSQDIEETEPTSFADMELTSELSRKELDLECAAQKKCELESAVARGDEELHAHMEVTSRKLATETQSVTLLERHRSCLNELAMESSMKKGSRADFASERSTAAERLANELCVASAATGAAKLQVEKARIERREADAAAKTHAAKLEAAVFSAEAALAMAGELKESTAAVMKLLRERARTRAADAAAAERLLDCRMSASREMNSKLDEVTKALERAEEQACSTARCLAVHTENSTRRSRAHEANVRRAEECANSAAALRDMRSRAAFASEDRDVLSAAQREAEEASEAAYNSLRAANEHAKRTRMADKEQAEILAAAAEEAAEELRKRTQVADAAKARCCDGEESAHAAAAAHEAAKSAANAAEEELRSTETRHEAYTTAYAGCTAKLASARDALVEARSKAAADQVPLRHMEEAEAAVLARRQAAEAGIQEALDAARTAAAEANDHDSSMDVVVTSCKARLADRERLLIEADAARAAAVTALDAGRDALSKQRALPSEDEDGESQTARMEALCVELEKVCHARESSYASAVSAVDAARAELADAETQHETRLNGTSLEDHIRKELACVDTALQGRNGNVEKLQAESDNRAAAWTDQRDELTAELHRAELKLSIAKEDVAATKLVKERIEK